MTVTNMADMVQTLRKQAEFDPEVRDNLRKMAGFAGSVAKNLENEGRYAFKDFLPHALATAAVMGTVGLANDAISDTISGVKSSISRYRNFNKMLDKHPNLKSHSNRTLVQDAFNTLHTLNPTYASDPLVSGSYVKRVIDSEGVDMNMLGALATSNKAINDASRKQDSLTPLLARQYATPLERAQDARMAAQDVRMGAQEARAVIEHGQRTEDFAHKKRMYSDQEKELANKLTLQDLQKSEYEHKNRMYTDQEQDLANKVRMQALQEKILQHQAASDVLRDQSDLTKMKLRAEINKDDLRHMNAELQQLNLIKAREDDQAAHLGQPHYYTSPFSQPD